MPVVVINRVAEVEKLLLAKFAKAKSGRDALQMTFSVFLDIFYPPILAVLRKMDFFNHTPPQ